MYPLCAWLTFPWATVCIWVGFTLTHWRAVRGRSVRMVAVRERTFLTHWAPCSFKPGEREKPRELALPWQRIGMAPMASWGGDQGTYTAIHLAYEWPSQYRLTITTQMAHNQLLPVTPKLQSFSWPLMSTSTWIMKVECRSRLGMSQWDHFTSLNQHTSWLQPSRCSQLVGTPTHPYIWTFIKSNIYSVMMQYYIVISRLHKLLVIYMCIPTCTFYDVL